MKDRSLLLLDAVGAALTLAVIGTVVWYAFAKPDTATSRLHALSSDVAQLQADHSRLQSALDAQSAKHKKLLASADAIGRLPVKSPIDENLKKIAALANQNNVKVLEVMPVSEVTYPNVLEHRYSITTEGTYTDHVQFLADFEQCPFWSDITHMKLERVATRANETSLLRRGELTVSFFSTFQ